jgi:anti-sigma B factor antagonist
MKITSKISDGIAFITMAGELDGKTAPDAQTQLLPIIADNTRVLMDLAEVTYMSSAGLRTMLLVYRAAKPKGGKVCLVNLLEPIRETMDATGFLEFFVIADSVAAGTALLKQA